jgi:HAE1 family hydrophobic/amphiphilic exporter-1
MVPQRLLSISVCLLATASAAAAQEPLTMAEATARALAKNHAIRIERESVAAADARVSGARGDYDPQLRFDFTAGRRRDPNASLFSGAPAGEVAPTTTNVGSSLSVSQLFKSGAIASIWTSTSREGTNSQLTLFQPAYLTSLGVDLRQPLLRNRAIDPTRAALHVTALDRERSGAALDRQLLQTVAEVEGAYWTLVAARRDIEVRQSSVALADQLRADTEVRIAAGTASPSDLAQPSAELERRRGDLFAAQEAAARAERALKSVMLDSARDPMWDVAIVPADLPETASVAVDVATAIDGALRTRPEMRELAAQISQRDISVTLAQDALKPRLDVVGGYAVYGLAGSRNSDALSIGGLPSTIRASLSGGMATSWQALAEQKFTDMKVGISLEIPVGQHAARGQLGEAVAARRQAGILLAQTEERIAVDVRNAATALDTAASRIQAARAGLRAAEVQLQAEQNRFGAGLTTSFFVLTRQNDLALARLAETSALTDYRRAATDLARASGTLLRDRGIHLQ